MFNVPIAIWINDYMYMQVNSDHDGRFSGSFQIGSNLFGGQLHIAAAHPTVTSSPQSQDVIFIEYLKLSLSKWSYQFYAAYVTNFTDFATIQNQGDFDLINITVDIIQDTICVENYSAWPTIIPVLPAFSNMTISLSMLLNCTLSAQYMNFSISESRISLLTSAGFIIDSQWSCRTQNGCSNHGSCINNETCFCADSYSGYSCEQCISDRYAYPSCIICPTCVRGQTICNSSVAICDCIDNTRIYGTLCQYCREGYYGDNCTNMPVLSSLFPRSSSELTNETLVTLVGDNFNNVSLFCLIIDQNDTISIPAVYINTGKITCQFPSHRAELIEVQLIMNESIVFSESKLVFQYLSSCPDTGCNQGLCISNTCQCWYPHFGSDCSLYPIPPVLTTIHNMTAIEMSSFTFNLSQYLTQGEFPLEWSLSGTIPSGLSITPYSGLLSWSSAVALSTMYSMIVNVRQSSTGIIAAQTFFISVPLSYNVTVQFQKTHQILRTKAKLQIDGQIISNSTNIMNDRNVKVWVLLNNIRRYLPNITVPGGSNRFTVYYTPQTNEFGTLFLGAEHPAFQSESEPQDYLTLLGLSTQVLLSDTLNVRIEENSTTSFVSVALLSNPCEYSIDNLTLFLISPVAVLPLFDASSSNCSLMNMPPFTTCAIDIKVRFNQTGSGTLSFGWSANGIQPVTISLSVKVIFGAAEFKLNPSSSKLIIPRKSQENLVIKIYNTGSFVLGPLTAVLPNQTYVFVITSEISILNVSENADFTFGIIIPELAPLTTFTIRGMIFDRTRSLSQPFDIQINIVGNNNTLFDLNIVCQDEFSYFGSNPTNLANVTITISNAQLNIKHVLKSNATGQASISLVAGFYEVTAQALKHTSYANVIKIDRVTASSYSLIIFLQRTLVSYTFKVTRIPFEQTYKIELDAQFVPYVDAPVLVISPTTVHLVKLETNENINQIDFTFTNYGLIRLTNLQLKLPNEHPYLRFTVRQLPIGDIEANSSIIVAVDVRRLNVTRMRRASLIVMAGEYLDSTVASYLTSGIGGGAESGGTASWGSSVPAGGGGTGSFGFGSSGDFSEMLQILGTTIDPVIAPLLPVPTCESCVGTLASAAADLLIQRLPIGWRVVLNVIDKCDHIHELGYLSLLDAYIGISQQYLDAHRDSPAGTCAVVTIRIVQNVTITRQGFDAELVIDNNGEEILQDIQVNIYVQTDDKSNATDRFSIGRPNITGDIHNKDLSPKSSGQFNWFIIPYSSAAPITSTWYSVGGQLSYTIDGQLVNITLIPDKIQVNPEARLDIAYFLEEYIVGPDPFSSQWIPPKPFILAVVITNSGYGSANNFRIETAQPEVIDNEKVANTVTETNTTAQIPDTSSTETSTITITTNSLLQSTPTTAINASSQSTTKSVTDTSFQFNTTSTTDSSSESSTTATAHESSQLTTTTTTDVSSESTTTISTDKSSQPMTTTTADLSSQLTITPTINTSFQSTTTTNIDLSSASRIRTITDESSQPTTTTTTHLSSESTTTISTDESSQPMTTTTPDLSSQLTITPTIDTSFQSTATTNIDLSSASRTTITTDESSQPTPTPTIEASSQPITTSITEMLSQSSATNERTTSMPSRILLIINYNKYINPKFT
ncbi:unnamed protein product [Rotaria sp. Silwood1]|nr:unnamed protein product [Rotaria sp. Silwood1]